MGGEDFSAERYKVVEGSDHGYRWHQPVFVVAHTRTIKVVRAVRLERLMYQLKDTPHRRANGFSVECQRVDDLENVIVELCANSGSIQRRACDSPTNSCCSAKMIAGAAINSSRSRMSLLDSSVVTS
jgi:hypothetical protein